MPQPEIVSGAKMAKIGLGVGVVALVLGWWLSSRSLPKENEQGEAALPSAPPVLHVDSGPARPGLSAPIAAAHVGTDVIVGGVDLAAKAVRVQRIDGKDQVTADRNVLGDVEVSNDSELKVSASADGVAITWRGLRKGKLVRELVVVGPDLAPKGEPAEVSAASCATREAVWFSDGSHATARPWNGPQVKLTLPGDDDASLLCSASRAFAVIEGDERTAILPLVAGETKTPPSPLTILRESEFGDDEQRELSEYTIGDDVGVVRLASSGAVATREISGTTVGPLRKLKTALPKDDDLVAVDASPKTLAIVHTQDLSAACPPSNPDTSPVSSKVTALRVERPSLEESTVELSPGRCGDEVGPFFTGAVGDAVSIAWVERTGGPGRARAPIVGLTHALVGASGEAKIGHIAAVSDALVDAGCDAAGCFAAMLASREGLDASAPSVVKVLRYNAP